MGMFWTTKHERLMNEEAARRDVDLAEAWAEVEQLRHQLAKAEHAVAWVPEVDEATQTVLWDAPCRCHGVVV